MESGDDEHNLENPIIMDTIRTVVLSGGAVRGISILGGLQCLHDRGLLAETTTFIGTSIGAVISYLYILGCSPVELMVTLCRKGFIEGLVEMDISALFRGQQGIASFSKVQEFLETVTVEKMGRFMTLSQLEQHTGKRLVCSTYNLTQRKMEYLSAETHPDLPCITALRMTTALPLLFPAFSYMGSVYADGALADDFPLSQIDPDAAEGVAVGLRVVDHSTTATSRSPVPSSSTSLLDYMNCIFSVFLENIHELSLRLYRDRCAQIFTLSVPAEVPVYRFYLSNTDKFNMFSTGYESVRLQLGRGGSGTNESIIR